MPPELKFVQTGKLFSSEGGEGEGETTGHVNLFGAESVELMTAH